jgi:hypothetical protein
MAKPAGTSPAHTGHESVPGPSPGGTEGKTAGSSPAHTGIENVPGPTPPSRSAAVNVFQTPGLFLAWGLRGGDWSPEAIVAKAAAAGFGWVARALQEPTDPAVVQQLRAACHAHRLHYAAWMSQPLSLDAILADDPNVVLFNVEQAEPDAEEMLAAFRAKHPKLPAGLVTNFFELDPKPWLSNDVFCLPEAYTVDDAEATVPAQVARALQLGWTADRVFPVVGCYHGFPFSDYEPHLSGGGWSVYTAETLQPADWTAHASKTAE